MNGIVISFRSDKGFGFIRLASGGKVVFRAGDVQPGNAAPQPGDEVEFEVEDFHLVPRATRVTAIQPQRKATSAPARHSIAWRSAA